MASLKIIIIVALFAVALIVLLIGLINKKKGFVLSGLIVAVIIIVYTAMTIDVSSFMRGFFDGLMGR